MTALAEPHYPSPKSVVVVFLVLFFLMGGIFAWAFYFNFGTLVLTSTIPFTVSINGKTFDCPRQFPALRSSALRSEEGCEISLPPHQYQAKASAPQHAEVTFEVEVKRWKKVENNLHFELIPYLKSFEGKLPEETLGYRFDRQLNLLDPKGTLVTSFESLKGPTLHVKGSSAVVVDSGRVFFVDLLSGAKIRRFDESVQVEGALLSDDAKKTVMFVISNREKALWIWDNEKNELTTLPWYEPAAHVQWDLGKNYRLVVLSTTLRDTSDSSVLDAETAPEKFLGLFQVNLDTEKIVKIDEFPGVTDQKIIRRGDRYFVTGEGSVKELIVQ